jgi:DNA-binding NarL/FixJ family response regulator
MARTCCLAGIDPAMVPMFSAVFRGAGEPSLAMLARLNVAELSRVAPTLLVCDLDGLDIDPLEMLRRIRFVLPDCTIAVYTGNMDRTWTRACHLAGANCLLSKDSGRQDLSDGLRDALLSGCYTDPRFVA